METVGGYLNFFIDRGLWASTVLTAIGERGERYGADTIGEGKTVVIDYSSINIAKPFAHHHLSTTAIGHALYRIHQYLGYKCVSINYLGDWGTQFGKQIVAYKRWGDRAAVEAGGIRELVRLYVRFHEEAEKEPALDDETQE